MKVLRAWLILGRVSNLPTVWTNVLAAWVLTRDSLAWATELDWLLLGASLLYLGGTTLNDFFDVAFDREYRKERPIPSGVLRRSTVGWACVGYALFGALAVGVGAGASWSYLIALIAAILVYDYRHKEWLGSVFVMGLCRLFLSLLAGSVGMGWQVTLGVGMHALSLFFYIVGLTFVARGESREAPLWRWPLALLSLPLIGSLGLGWGEWSWAHALSVGAFVGLLAGTLRVLGNRQDTARIGKSVGLMLAGICLIDGLFLTLVLGWWGAVIGIGGFGVSLLLQRMVPAT